MNLFKNTDIILDASYLQPELTPEMISRRQSNIELIANELHNGTCAGSEFTGWLIPDEIVSVDEYKKIKECCAKLHQISDVLLVIGIGGSYLGARAVIEALSDNPEKVLFAGQNVSADYMVKLKKQLEGKRVAVNVVSKSGTTTEPALAFRILKDLVPAEKAKDLIIATTDANKGALLQMARTQGYETFVVPDNVGGRFSVFSAVGLLPIAYAGINTDDLLNGASAMYDLCRNTNPIQNPAYYYAAARNVLYSQGFCIELLSYFEPRLHYVAEWWKQLFGESEGKEFIGLYPSSAEFTTDLHSLGQYIQQGRRTIIETFMIIDKGEPSLLVPEWEQDADGMNYLSGKEISYVNNIAYKATAKAHREGGVPNCSLVINKLDASSLGALMYFFEIACAITCLLSGVNPFNQPGVEAYKRHMFEMLGKPGYKVPKNEAEQQLYITF